MASNPLFRLPYFFFFHFPKELTYATLSLKEMEKFLWEDKKNWAVKWKGRNRKLTNIFLNWDFDKLLVVEFW